MAIEAQGGTFTTIRLEGVNRRLHRHPDGSWSTKRPGFEAAAVSPRRSLWRHCRDALKALFRRQS